MRASRADAKTGGDRRATCVGGLLASLMTAFCAHTLIERVGTWSARDADLHADAYAAHAHAAIVPVILVAAMLLVTMLLGVAIRAVSGEDGGTRGVAALARELRRVSPAAATGFVAAGGMAILILMECAEQFMALGHVGALRDALGGNIFLGCSIVGIVAALLTIVGLRSAVALVTITMASAISLVSWIVARLDVPSLDVRSAACRNLRPRGRAGAIPGLYASSCRTLRAPPPTFDKSLPAL